jgi:hypothetical protein
MGITIKYLRRRTSGAACNGLGAMINYLVNQNAGAGNKWAKALSLYYTWAKIVLNPIRRIARPSTSELFSRIDSRATHARMLLPAAFASVPAGLY